MEIAREIDFFENEKDFQRIRCGEVFYENKEQKLSYECLFCNILFEEDEFPQFNQHLLEHLDIEEKVSVEKETEFLNLAVLNADEDSEFVENDTTESEFISKTVMKNIQSFSQNDTNGNNLDKVRKFQCPYCEANYRRRSPLYSHIEKKHGIVTSFEIEPNVFGKYSCPECDTECFNKGSFILHVRRKHEEYYYSTLDKQQIKKDLESKKFAQNDTEILIKDDINRESHDHVDYIKEVEFVESDIAICLDSVSNPASKTEKRPFFDDENDIYNLGSTKKKKHDCPCCQFTNTTRYGICKHLEKQHGISAILKVEPNSNGKFECSQCGTIFDHKGNLSYHLRQKHEKHYFKLLEKQQEKFEIKSGSTPAKWFENKCENNDFVDMTLGEFGVREIMSKVKKIHRCSYCLYWTGRRNNLYRHLESKHNIAALLDVEPNSDGKYECPHCSLVITVKGNFIHHLKRKHREFFCERLLLQQRKRDGLDPEIENEDHESFLQTEQNEIVAPVTETLIEFVDFDEASVEPVDELLKFENNFTCTHCDASYLQETALIRHLEESHRMVTELEIGRNTDVEFEHSPCKITIANNESLISHLKIKKHKSYARKLSKEIEDYELESETPNKIGQITDMSSLKRILQTENSTLEHSSSSPAKGILPVVKKSETDAINITANKFYNCLKCEYKSKFRSLVCRHLESKHNIITELTVNKYPDGKYHCLKCTKKISNKQIFIDHLKQQHENYYYHLLVKQEIEIEINSLKTNPILKVSEDESSEEENEQEDNDALDIISSINPFQKINNMYNCPEKNCEYKSRSLKTMKNHNREEHGDLFEKTFKYQCPFCTRSYSAHGGIAKHLDLVHGVASGIANKVSLEPESDGRFHCKKCDFIADKKLSFSKHLFKNHKDYYYELLSQQQSVSSQKKKIICEICQKELPTTTSLKQHIAYHNQPKIKCEICGKVLNNKSSYNAHKKIHLGIRNYSCKFCDLTFVKKEVKDKHETRIHLKQKNYTCDTCGQGYYTRNLLNNHLRRHTNERPAECNVCHKTFFDTNGLRNHKQIHLEVKKYGCNICGRRFRRAYLLRTHKELHEGSKKYKCVICDLSFAQNAGLYSHMRTKHKDLSEIPEDPDKS